MSSVVPATELEGLELAQLARRALAELRTKGALRATTHDALVVCCQSEAEMNRGRGSAPLPGLPYARRTSMVDTNGEVMLAQWAPHLRCAPHDHGGSSGLVLVVAGRFDERTFTFDGRRLIEGPHVRRDPGSTIAVSPSTIHDMECLGPGGVTLHLYAPAPKPMRLYDVERRATVVVGEGHGAWLPAHAPLEVSPWSA